MARKRFKKFTDQQLRKCFDNLNKRFFDSNISSRLIVRFATGKELAGADGHHKHGPHMPKLDEILIHEDLRRHPDLALFVLLHEMAHADITTNGYIGDMDGGHSTLWHARIDKLYRQGAYEGLL